jgi:hypothetical protein
MRFRFAEFQRQCWLEFSRQRLVVMPLILAGILFLVHLANDVLYADDYAAYAIKMQDWCASLFGLLVLVWGTRMASSTITEELAARTWDFQRMSSLSAHEMLFGKLLGGTSYAWYGGAMLLAVFVYFDIRTGTETYFIFSNLLHFILMGIFAHAMAIFLMLLALRASESRHKPRGTMVLLLVLFVVLLLPLFVVAGFSGNVSLLPEPGNSVFETVSWYGRSFYVHSFFLLSLLTFTSWTVLASYRVMASELQTRQYALAWPIFLVFLCVYVAGFSPEIPELEHVVMLSPSLVSSLVITSIALYIGLFFDPTRITSLRAFVHHLRLRHTRKILELIPAWVSGGIVFTACLLVAMLHIATRGDDGMLYAFSLCPLLWFFLRDAGIYVLLILSGARRTRAAFFVYLWVLYFLIPVTLESLAWPQALALFTPIALDTDQVLLTNLSALAQAAVAWLLVKRQWLRH